MKRKNKKVKNPIAPLRNIVKVRLQEMNIFETPERFDRVALARKYLIDSVTEETRKFDSIDLLIACVDYLIQAFPVFTKIDLKVLFKRLNEAKKYHAEDIKPYKFKRLVG